MTDPTTNGRAIAAFNTLPEEDAIRRLMACLAVPRWAREVADGRPYPDLAALTARAEAAAAELTDGELSAALARHPRIGERPAAGHDAAFSAREQSGVAPDDTISARLTAGNRAYERRFGRVFLIRAAGRDGAEILAELERRLGNDDKAERAETVAQLREIAVRRLNEVVGAIGAEDGARPDEKGSRR